MLNPFPIQFLALLAYTLLRISVGCIFLYLGFNHALKKNAVEQNTGIQASRMKTLLFVIGFTELTIGILFIIGFYTQIAALVSVVLCILCIIFNSQLISKYVPRKIFFLLMLVASVSLFITGAGAFAFDLPI